MSSLPITSGRINQKIRTRNALLEAAQRLVGAGQQPSIAEVAAAAQISLATAYRYFSNRETVLLEAALHRQVAPPEVVVPDRVTDPAERASCVQAYLFDLTAKNEATFRLFLAATMQEWVRSEGATAGTLRGGRRIAMLERALEPLRKRLDDETYERLFFAIAAMSGLEAFIALTDVCQLERDRAKEVMTWAVQTLTRAAAGGAGRDTPRTTRGRSRAHRGEQKVVKR